MGITAKLLLLPLLALSLSAPFMFESDANARNIIHGFTKRPTFTPPPNCIRRTRTYGVLSRCEKPVGRGRNIVVLIDTAAGAGTTREYFIKDHVREIKAHWKSNYSRVEFSSRASGFAPRNIPRHSTTCLEYSIRAQLKNENGKQPGPKVVRVKGLTCGWYVDRRKPRGWTIEIFWLEVYDYYIPSLGQKSYKNFDAIVRRVFSSVRL